MTTPADALRISPPHAAILRDRAIPLDAAQLAGLRSVDAVEAGRLLGLRGPASSSALVIPYPGVEPPYVRIRLDAGSSRYLCPAQREVPIYSPPGLPAAPTIDGEVAEAIIVVEAPLKALSLAAAGLQAVGLGGVATTLDKNGRLNSSWDGIDLSDRLVVICFDGNRRTNQAVARAEARLVIALETAGAKQVRVADLPAGPRGQEEWGPDDFLAAQGKDALLKVLNDSVGGNPLERLDSLDEETVVDLLDDKPFLTSLVTRGEACRHRAIAAFKKLKVPKKSVETAIDLHTTEDHSHEAPKPTADTSANPYTIKDGRFCAVKYDREGEPLEIPICNFTARILEDVTVDDGAEQHREFMLEGKTDTGAKLALIAVESREFASASAIWATAGWGAAAIVHADCMQHVRPAIQYSSEAVHRSTIYQHTGWRIIGERLVYLSASGALGAEVDVNVRLDTTLTRYSLPPEPATREQIQRAVIASLRILDAAPDRVTFPALASVYRAPLCEWLYCDAVVWIYGPTGSLKSSLAALLLGHFGTSFERERLTASWHDTPTSIETKLFRAKDALVVIDDFAPNASHDFDSLRRLAAQVIRGVGNGQSRSRMKSDLTARSDRPPRSLALGTGEDMPSGESIVARTFPIAMRREDVRLAVLSDCQREAHLYPVAMRGFLTWLAAKVTASTDFAGTMKQMFQELRTVFSAGGHLRAPAAAAHLAIGLQAFSAFALDVGAITESHRKALEQRCDEALRAQLTAQATVSIDEDAVRQFLRWLTTLLAAGRAFLEVDNEEITQLAGRETIGWRCADGRIHLLPDVAYAAVHKAMREAGQSLRLKGTTLWGRLEELGHATAYETGRQTVKRTHAGKRYRVVEIVPGVLDDGDGPDETPSGGSGSESENRTPTQAAPSNAGAPGSAQKDVPDTGSSGARQHAAILTENGKCPDRPAPPGVGGPTGPASAQVFGKATEPATHETPLPRGGGAIGAGGGEKSNLLNDRRVLSAPRPVPGDRGAAGTIGAQAGPAPFTRVAFELIADAGRLPDLAQAVEAAGTVGLDMETTGLDPLRDRPRLLQLALPDRRVFVLDVFTTKTLGPLVEALGRVEIVGHNLAFDLSFLMRHFGSAPRTWDTMLAAQLIDGGTNVHAKGYFTLGAVVGREFGIELDKTLQQSDWAGELGPSQIEYAARDVVHLLPLRDALQLRLTQRSLDAVMQIECGLLPVLVAMQLAGVPVDVAALDALAETRARESIEACDRVRASLEIDNPASPKQLLPGLRAAGLNVSATSAEALAPYRDHPVVRDLAIMRTAKKTADDARALAEAARAQADGRVRPRWFQVAAPTGRMATRGPNMLGLPKDPAMRTCIAAPPGRTFVIADYAAIELRVLAQVTGDRRLTAIFRAAGDPHRELAATLARKAPGDVTADERKRAKALNFGFAFGMGADRFVAYALKDYNVSFTPGEAARFRSAYLGAYRQVDEWQQRTRARMEREVRTLAGRVRDFAGSRDGYTERLNLPVQGTAADGMKRAMALLGPRLAALGAQIVLAVHDEIVVEAPEGSAEEVRAAVEHGMVEGMAVDLSNVPIVVDVAVQRTWGK